MGNPARNHESQHDHAANAAAEPQPRNLQRQGHGVGCQETEDLNVGKHRDSDTTDSISNSSFIGHHRSHLGRQKKRSRNANKIIRRGRLLGRLPKPRRGRQRRATPAGQLFGHLLQLLGRHGPGIVPIAREIHLVKMVQQARRACRGRPCPGSWQRSAIAARRKNSPRAFPPGPGSRPRCGRRRARPPAAAIRPAPVPATTSRPGPAERPPRESSSRPAARSSSAARAVAALAAWCRPAGGGRKRRQARSACMPASRGA